MKFLLENQISSFLKVDKSIEQYIDKIEHTNYSGFRWIGIERTKDNYTLVVHKVFDDSSEMESIYDYSYIEPDDIYGNRIQEFTSLTDALEMAEKLFGATTDKYLPFGFLDEYLIDVLNN
jgi:hypothetical protein